MKQKKVNGMKKGTTILAFFLALAASFGDGGETGFVRRIPDPDR
jgi:hypothetical protein